MLPHHQARVPARALGDGSAGAGGDGSAGAWGDGSAGAREDGSSGQRACPRVRGSAACACASALADAEGADLAAGVPTVWWGPLCGTAAAACGDELKQGIRFC